MAAACLIGLWFVPETWIAGPIFQWEIIGGAGIRGAAAAVAGPACGALLLILLLAPSPPGWRRVGGAILGATALTLPLLGPATGIGLPVTLVLPAAAGLALLAAFAMSRGRGAAAHLLLLAVPLATMVRFLVFAALDDLPLTYLAGLKAPVRIWAAGLALASTLPPVLARSHRKQ